MTRMNADIVRWCATCNEWFQGEGRELKECPKCGKLPKTARCTRCGYEWVFTRAMYPKVCTHCKSKYWASERTQDRTEEQMAKPFKKVERYVQGKSIRQGRLRAGPEED